jgi:hypothetical protein
LPSPFQFAAALHYAGQRHIHRRVDQRLPVVLVSGPSRFPINARTIARVGIGGNVGVQRKWNVDR